MNDNLASFTPPWRVLLIGGTSNVGKSTIAKELGRLYGVSVLPADDFWMALQKGTTESTHPSLHSFERPAIWTEDPNHLVGAYLAAAETVSDALERVIAHHATAKSLDQRHRVDPVIVEGCWILPRLGARSTHDGKVTSGLVAAFFIAEDDESSLDARFRKASDWFQGLTLQEQSVFVRMQAEFGRVIAAEAQALGLPVIPSRPLETLLDRCHEALTHQLPEVHREPREGTHRAAP